MSGRRDPRKPGAQGDRHGADPRAADPVIADPVIADPVTDPAVMGDDVETAVHAAYEERPTGAFDRGALERGPFDRGGLDAGPVDDDDLFRIDLEGMGEGGGFDGGIEDFTYVPDDDEDMENEPTHAQQGRAARVLQLHVGGDELDVRPVSEDEHATEVVEMDLVREVLREAREREDAVRGTSGRRPAHTYVIDEDPLEFGGDDDGEPLPAPADLGADPLAPPAMPPAWSSEPRGRVEGPKRRVRSVVVPVDDLPRKPRNDAGRTFALMGLAGLALGAVVGVGAWYLSNAQPEGVRAPELPSVFGDIADEAPEEPFAMPEPAPFGLALLDGEPAGPREQMIAARSAAEDAGRPDVAAAWSDRLVRAAQDPRDFFDHASRLAGEGDVEGALHWLGRAAREHGVHPRWVVEDPRFASLWQDARWDALARWLVEVHRFHEAGNAVAVGTVVTPSDYDGTRPIPLVVFLDERGGAGTGVSDWGVQVADAMGVAWLGLGGPVYLGPHSREWASDGEKDVGYVLRGLDDLDGVAVDPAHVYVVGVGQGAELAVETLLRKPERVAGVVAVWPDPSWQGDRDYAAESITARDQEALLVAGAAANPTDHTLLRTDRGRLLRAGVDVEMSIDEQRWPGRRPADFAERLPRWLESVGVPRAPLSGGEQVRGGG